MIDYQRVEPRDDVSGVYVCTTWGQQPDRRYDRMIEALLVHAVNTGLRMRYRDHNGKSGVAAGHNVLIRDFLATDYAWMLHLDGDALITPGHLERMASWQAPIVTALTFRRKPPYTPTIYRVGSPDGDGWLQEFDQIRSWLYDNLTAIQGTDYPPVILESEACPLIAVKRAGTHCMLTHRSVFEAIEPPWFAAKFESGAGSDFDFCEKTLAAGFAIYCDRSVIAGHLQGDYCAGPLDWLVWDKVTSYDRDGHDGRLEIRIGPEAPREENE